MLFGLLTACNHTNQKESYLPKEEILELELMALQGITDPMRVDIKHPFLILQNANKVKDSIFHIYDLTTKQLKCSFGVRGEGPYEFVTPWLVRTCLPDMIFADIDKQSFYRFAIDKNGQAVFQKKIEPKYPSSNLEEVSFVNDSLFIINPQYTGPYIHLCSINDKTPKKSWQYRDPNRGNASVNDHRIIFCYTYKKQIDFMDTQFNLIKRQHIKNIPILVHQ